MRGGLVIQKHLYKIRFGKKVAVSRGEKKQIRLNTKNVISALQKKTKTADQTREIESITKARDKLDFALCGHIDDVIAGRQEADGFEGFGDFLVEVVQFGVGLGAAQFRALGIAAEDAASEHVAQVSNEGLGQSLGLGFSGLVGLEAFGQSGLLGGTLARGAAGSGFGQGTFVAIGVLDELGVDAQVFDGGEHFPQKGAALSIGASFNASGGFVGVLANFGQQFFVVQVGNVFQFGVAEVDQVLAESGGRGFLASLGAIVVGASGVAVTVSSFQSFIHGLVPLIFHRLGRR